MCVVSDRPIRLLAVGAVNGFGGPMRSLATVLGYLGKRVEVIIATQPTVSASNRPAGGHRSPIQDLAVDEIAIPIPRGFQLLRAQWALLRSIRRLRGVDAVHANGLTEAIVALPAAFLTRSRVVVWVHNYAVPRPFALAASLLGPVLRRWRWAAVSKTARDLLPDDWMVELIPNPIEPGPTEHAPPQPAPCSAVYLAGTDHPVKGFDLLPAVIRATPAETVRFVVHAERSRRSDHPTARAAWDELEGPLADRVEIRPFVADVAQVLAAADLVLVPSRRESFNRVLAEALAHGVPVVASDISAHLEHFEAGPVGRTFKSGDALDASRAITALALDVDERRHHANRGRQHVEPFVPAQVAARLLAAWGGS